MTILYADRLFELLGDVVPAECDRVLISIAASGNVQIEMKETAKPRSFRVLDLDGRALMHRLGNAIPGLATLVEVDVVRGESLYVIITEFVDDEEMCSELASALREAVTDR